MANEWDFGSFSKIIVFFGYFNGHVKNVLKVFKVYTGEMVLRKEMQKEEDSWSSVMKESYAWQTHCFMRQTKEKSLIVLVDMKQKLILCLWEKI